MICPHCGEIIHDPYPHAVETWCELCHKRIDLVKREAKIINGESYDFVLCPRCEVWIPTEVFQDGKHESCDRNFKNLEVRKRAEARVI